jgi:DNA uptake protein ComE-like DNA-binding protein
MRAVVARVGIAIVCGVLGFSLALPSTAEAERRGDTGSLLLWFLGFRTAREQEESRKTDVNSASVEELTAVPGLGQHEAKSIALNRPYAKLQDLVRAGLSPARIEHLAPRLTADPAAPRSSPSGAAPSTPPAR